MDKIIVEIIVGVVALTLLISVVPLYRDSAELVVSAGERLDGNEAVKEVTIGQPPEIHDIVSGKYLLKYLEYCIDHYQFTFYIELNGKRYIYQNKLYEPLYELIESSMLFEVTDFMAYKEQIYIRFRYYETKPAETEPDAAAPL